MNVFADILSGTILFAVPLILVALGGMFSERSGIVNIALEGIMIIGALVGCLFLSAVAKGSWAPGMPQLTMFLAILLAGISGIVFSLFLAFASVNLKADQTISGTSLNMLAPALAIVVSWAIQGSGQTTIYIPTWIKITQADFGFAASSAPSFFERFAFKSFYLTTPIAIAIIVIAAVVLYKTRFGLRLRACGEHPQAADSVGVNVYKMRYAGVAISGFLGGIGGLAFTIAVGSGFQSGVSGYGFLALAVMIFGNWKPLRIAGAALLFAFFKIIGPMSQNIPFLPSFSGVKSSEYIYLMLPYIVTMIVLAFTSRRSLAPKAEGIPYDKSLR
ncbi:MAG TPA: ABC transporter permease [Eubacteriales bacterium]|jgi:simple sugar transport system permease protein|nr:ABC transporter permease [Clostridia bacterium]HRR90390.1 ABC transporter permease [Eubacteriales bacterium]HRU84668.1 ABC transporter permease [Eubacteriales bacterium]